METRSAHPRVEEKEEAPSWGLEPCLCEFQAAESGLHSAGKAAVLQPKIHNILGRMYLFCFVLLFFPKISFKKKKIISLPLQRLSIPRAWGEEPKALDRKSL